MQATVRETIRAITVPLLLIAVGILFLADYSGGLSARQTWPVLLILLGLSLALQSVAGDDGRDRATAPSPQPRRKSLLLPIFLIAAGSLLLAWNFWPEIPLRAWLAGYWPWILILWGGARLLEVVLARLLGWSLPRRLGAGAVFAALLLVLIGSAGRVHHERGGFNLVTIPAFGFLQDTYDFPVERSHHDLTGGTLVFKNLRGRVQVTGGDRDALVIRGKKRVRASNRQAAAELDRGSRLDVSQSGLETTVGVDWMDDEVRRVSFDLKLDTPQSVALRAGGQIEEISIKNISGSVSVSSGPRVIRLSKIGGPVRLRTNRGRKVEAEDLAATFELNGKVATVELTRVAGTVDIRGELFGTIRLAELQADARIRSKNGELRFATLPGEVEVKVRSVSSSRIQGPVRLNSDRWRRVTLERLSGDVEIQGERMDVELSADESFGDIEVTLERGDIELWLPEEAKFTLDAVTDRGKIRLPRAEPLRLEENGSRSAAHGTTGQGPTIRLRTGRGDIVLRTAQAGAEKPVRAVSLARDYQRLLESFAMERLLEEAMSAASKLSAREQEAIGAWLLAEIKSERRWDESFAKSGSALERMADQALGEHQQGSTAPLDPDRM